MVFSVDPYRVARHHHRQLRRGAVARGAQRASVLVEASQAGRARRAPEAAMSIDRRRFLQLSGGVAHGGLLSPRATPQGPDSAQGILLVRRAPERERGALPVPPHVHGPRAARRGCGGEGLSAVLHLGPRADVGRGHAGPVDARGRQGSWTTRSRLSLDDLQKLPRITQRVNHFCVEGWTAVAAWTGTRVSELAKLAGVHPDGEVRRLRSRSTTAITRAGTWTAPCIRRP